MQASNHLHSEGVGLNPIQNIEIVLFIKVLVYMKKYQLRLYLITCVTEYRNRSYLTEYRKGPFFICVAVLFGAIK